MSLISNLENEIFDLRAALELGEQTRAGLAAHHEQDHAKWEYERKELQNALAQANERANFWRNAAVRLGYGKAFELLNRVYGAELQPDQTRPAEQPAPAPDPARAKINLSELTADAEEGDW